MFFFKTSSIKQELLWDCSYSKKSLNKPYVCRAQEMSWTGAPGFNVDIPWYDQLWVSHGDCMLNTEPVKGVSQLSQSPLGGWNFHHSNGFNGTSITPKSSYWLCSYDHPHQGYQSTASTTLKGGCGACIPLTTPGSRPSRSSAATIPKITIFCGWDSTKSW